MDVCYDISEGYFRTSKGTMRMYRDKDVDKYYDESLLGNYSLRYNLFIMVVSFTGIIAIAVPFVMR